MLPQTIYSYYRASNSWQMKRCSIIFLRECWQVTRWISSAIFFWSSAPFGLASSHLGKGRANKRKKSWELWPSKCLQDGGDEKWRCLAGGGRRVFISWNGDCLHYFPTWWTVIHNTAFCPLGRIFQLPDSTAIFCLSQGPEKEGRTGTAAERSIST